MDLVLKGNGKIEEMQTPGEFKDKCLNDIYIHDIGLWQGETHAVLFMLNCLQLYFYGGKVPNFSASKLPRLLSVNVIMKYLNMIISNMHRHEQRREYSIERGGGVGI